MCVFLCEPNINTGTEIVPSQGCLTLIQGTQEGVYIADNQSDICRHQNKGYTSSTMSLAYDDVCPHHRFNSHHGCSPGLLEDTEHLFW